MPGILPQPDFIKLAASLKDVVTEVECIPNIPPPGQDNHDLRDLLRAMNDKLDGLTDRFEDLSVRVDELTVTVNEFKLMCVYNHCT